MTEREWVQHLGRASVRLSHSLGQVEWADGLLADRAKSRIELNWPYIEERRADALAEIPDLRAGLMEVLGQAPAGFPSALALGDGGGS